MTLADAAPGRDNNYALIRFLAAFCVLVSHAYPVTRGPGALDPLEAATGLSLGTAAVYVFFGISGFLVAQSYARAASFGDWTLARGLRVFPALAVVLTLTVLVIGPAVTALPHWSYATEPGSWSYVPRNLSLVHLQYDLPGVFRSNPYGPAINGSLWTLFHEVACYAALLVAGLLGALRHRHRLTLLIAGYAVFYLSLPALRDSLGVPAKLLAFRDLSLPFVIGVLFFNWRARVSLRWSLGAGLAAIPWLGWGGTAGPVLFALALVYGVFLLAYRIGGPIRAFNRLGDYSYGIYIYAFPMQQLAVHLWPGHGPLTNIALATPATLILAVLSWHLIERPALASRASLHARLTSLKLTAKPG